MSRFVMLSGPSCVGKTPLRRALSQLHPDLAEQLTNLVLYNSRQRRPTEREGVEYHFRPRAEIAALAQRDDFVLIHVRNDLQALDRTQLQDILDSGRTAFWEGNPAVMHALEAAGGLAGVDALTVFVSPLSRDEIISLKSCAGHGNLRGLVTDLMRRKLFRRARHQQGALSPDDLADLDVRAGTAYDELRIAWKFEAVIPNHDGEDSENWSAFPVLLGEARRTTETFAALLRGQECDGVEHWERDLVP